MNENNSNSNILQQLDLMKLLDIVLERIVSIVIISLVFGLATFAVSKYFITPKYESKITMYVNNKKSTNSLVEQEVRTNSSDLDASQKLVTTYIEMIKSDNVLEAVSNKFKEDTGKTYSINSLRGMIEASALGSTEILEVRVKTSEAAESKTIADIIANIAPTKIQYFIDKSDVKIIDYAKISTSPVSPNMRNNTIIGSLVGFILSISYILLKELFDVRVKSSDDLTGKYGYPVIGNIPEIFVSYDDLGYEEREKSKE